MSENGQAQPTDTLLCGFCTTAYEPDDNFCRHCGVPLQDDTQLPAVRERQLPAIRQTSLPAGVARGAAVVAAGTIAEVLVRRAVRGLFNRTAPGRRSKGEVVPRQDLPDEETELLSETFLLRRVRIRR